MRSSVEIQEDLDAAYISRRTALQAQSYSLNSGQGSQAVTRASLSQINETIKDLQAELEAAINSESGYNGIVSGSFKRY